MPPRNDVILAATLFYTVKFLTLYSGSMLAQASIGAIKRIAVNEYFKYLRVLNI